MRIRRKIIMIKCWLKIINSENNSLVVIMYNVMENDININNRNNWAYQIKLILDEIELSNLWLQQNEITCNISFQIIRS